MRSGAGAPAPANLQAQRIRVALERFEGDARAAGRAMAHAVDLLSVATETFVAAIARENFPGSGSGDAPDRMLSAGEAAKHIGVGRSTFDEYVRAGLIPQHRLPGATSDRALVRFSARELDAWLASRSVPARSAS